MILPGLIIAALVVAPASSTNMPGAMKPTAGWVVDFDDAQCVATRAYGPDQLFLKASPIGDVVQIGLSAAGAYEPARQLDAVVQPQAGSAFRGNALAWGTKGKDSSRVKLINMPVKEFQRIAMSTSLRIRIGSMQRHFALSGMDKLAEVMKTCVDDLQRVWSPGVEGGKAARAKANLRNYVKDSDYPGDAVREFLTGTTTFALLIDEKGRVADCMVTETSGQAILDTQACAALRERARFEPAKDAAGKPTRDRVTGRINWRLGGAN